MGLIMKKTIFLFLICFMCSYIHATNFNDMFNRIVTKYVDGGFVKEINLNEGNIFISGPQVISYGKNSVILFFDDLMGLFENTEVLTYQGYNIFQYSIFSVFDRMIGRATTYTVWGIIMTIHDFAAWMGIRLLTIVQLDDGDLRLAASEVFVAASEKHMYYHGMATLSSPYLISPLILSLMKYFGYNNL